jgi:hypothetical protein
VYWNLRKGYSFLRLFERNFFLTEIQKGTDSSDGLERPEA